MTLHHFMDFTQLAHTRYVTVLGVQKILFILQTLV